MAFIQFSGNSKFRPDPKPIKSEKKTPKGRINPISNKRKEENKVYKVKRKAFIEGKRCAVYPELKATDVHHKKGRTGKLFLDEEFWLPVSRKGHKKIEENPVWAKKMGFSLNRL